MPQAAARLLRALGRGAARLFLSGNGDRGNGKKAAIGAACGAFCLLLIPASALSLPGLLGKSETAGDFVLEKSEIYQNIRATYQEYFKKLDERVESRRKAIREQYRYTVTTEEEITEADGSIKKKTKSETRYPDVIVSKYFQNPKLSSIFAYITVKHCDLQNMSGMDKWEYDNTEILAFLDGVTEYTEETNATSRETVCLTVHTNIMDKEAIARKYFPDQPDMYEFACSSFEEYDAAYDNDLYAAVSEAGGQIGWVSRLYETGSAGSIPGMISTGDGDAGGKSYGTIQLSYTRGSLQNFLNWLASYDAGMAACFSGLALTGADFDAAWTKLAQERGNDFAAAQNLYGYNMYAIPWINNAKKASGIDFSRSYALQEMAYSRGVQLGSSGGMGVFASAGISSGDADADIITKYYGYLHDHVDTFWKNCSERVRKGVADRMVNEANTLLGIVGQERPQENGDGGTGEDVAAYACQFVGNPYVWGGVSLTNGVDCSGFIMKVYEHFGFQLPHSSSAQRECGTKVCDGFDAAKARPGDILCFDGHVALYIGNNHIVHAANSKDGIKISNATYRPAICTRRIITD